MKHQSGNRRGVREAGFWIACLGILVLSGCNKFSLAPVSGTVTLDGVPTADVELIFEPKQSEGGSANVGPYSIGTTDSTGKFTLKTKSGEEGAIVGEHIVMFNQAGGIDPEEMLGELSQELQAAKSGDGDDSKVEEIKKKIEQLRNGIKIPEKYQGSGTEISATVVAGQNDFKFDLKSGDE